MSLAAVLLGFLASSCSDSNAKVGTLDLPAGVEAAEVLSSYAAYAPASHAAPAPRASVEAGGFFESQNIAYVPKTGVPIHVPNVEGATKTRYRVALVGPGTSIGDHHELTEEERKTQTEVFLEFLVKDFLLPFVAQIVVPASDLESKLDSDIAGDVVQDLIGVLSEGAPSIQQKAAAGDIDGAVADLWDVTVGQDWVRDAILALVIDSFYEASKAAAAARATSVATKFIAISGTLVPDSLTLILLTRCFALWTPAAHGCSQRSLAHQTLTAGEADLPGSP